MAGGLDPRMLQMLAAGGAGGPPDGGQPAPAAAPPQAAAIGRMLQGQRQTPTGSGQMEAKIVEQAMVQLGKVIQSVMLTNPKAYQAFLKAQMSMHTGLQELKQSAQDSQEHQQMTSSIMQLLGSQPGSGGGAPTGGPAPGAGQQLG